MSIDTLTLARELRAADFAQPQAEAIAAAIGRAVVETAATKADLAQAVAGLKAKIALLDGKIEQQGIRLSGELRSLGGELKASVTAVEATIMKWFIGAILAIGGLILAAAKFL